MKLTPTEQKDPDFGANDYYAVLGISPDANPAEIKQAYRTLANKNHPDKDTGGHDEFNLVKEAYDILADPKRRATYDKYGRLSVEQMNKSTSLITQVVDGILSGDYDLALLDVVGSVDKSIRNNMVEGEKELNKQQKQKARLEKNRHRSSSKFIRPSFLKHIGVCDEHIKRIEAGLLINEIALWLIKNEEYDFDQTPPEPEIPQGAYFYVGAE